MAALVNDDRIYETSTTTGTGSYTLAGAVTGFQAFSVIGAANYCWYFATDDVNWEVGIGTYSASPDTLARTAVIASSNGDAAVDWAAGTRKIRCGLPAWGAAPQILSKSVAGSSNVTLTAHEQRRKVLVFTGALTGNIDVIVDTTVWDWIVYNNTSGACTLTMKVSGQTGVVIPQGQRQSVHCDGTDVRRVGRDMVLLATATASDDATVDFSGYFSSVFEEYLLTIKDLVPATDTASLLLRLSQASSFLAGASDYGWTRIGNENGGTVVPAGDAADTSVTIASGLGTGTGESLSGEIRIYNPAGSSAYKRVSYSASWFGATATDLVTIGAGGIIVNATAVDGVRLLMSSGNIASGTFALYGLRS